MPVHTKHPPVIITGMHRSGTSLAASILSSLAIDVGKELLTADSNNARGYFEDVEFLELHRAILSACCSANDGGHPDWGWTENESLDPDSFNRYRQEAVDLLSKRSVIATPWGWKDPRTSLLLDFWDELLPDARYIFLYRYPWDVADSMQRLGADVFLRNPDYGYRIWQYYNRRIRDFYRKHPDRCLLISSNALPNSSSEFRRLIVEKLGVNVSDAEISDIHEEELLSVTGGCDPLIDLIGLVMPGCIELLRELDNLADISAKERWQARPVSSRLGRPDRPTETGPIDVSIVTPCYNQGVFLVEAIASVERFAPPNCELIIVNDGSCDQQTLEILDTLKRGGYFIVDQQNLGLSAARNAAISMARGRYILPLDDDNRIRANFIEDAKRALDASPEIGVVYGDRSDFGLYSGAHEIPEFDLVTILRMNYIDACAVFRRQMWTDCGGYDSQMSPMEDWELWIHAAERGWLFHHLHYLTFDYRIRPGSLISGFQSPQALEEFRKRILVKHQMLSDKLFRELAPEYADADLVTSIFAADRERTDLLRSQLEIQRERVDAFEAKVVELKELIGIQGESISQGVKGNGVAETGLLQRLANRDAELARIKRSFGWRLLQAYGRIKYRHLLPVYRALGLPTQPEQAAGVELDTGNGANSPIDSSPAVHHSRGPLANSIALVTASFGGIDEVKPIPDHHGIEAFCYTDGPVPPDVARTWTRVINPNYPRYDFNPRLRAKYFKLQIHRLDEVRNHHWLVWADGSLAFKNLAFLKERALELSRLPANQRALFMPHPDRATVIEEFEFVEGSIQSGHPYLEVRYSNEKMREQIDYYRERGWNVQAKLWCGTVWMVENSELNRRALDDWWEQNLRFGIQDQLSLPIVLANHGIEPTALPIEPRQNDYFQWCRHKNKSI